MTVYLGQTKVRVSELRSLRPGDVLPLEKRTGHDLVLQIAGRNKFAGSPGQLRGHKALRLKRRAEIDELL